MLRDELSCIEAELLFSARVQQISRIMTSFPVPWQLCSDWRYGRCGVVNWSPNNRLSSACSAGGRPISRDAGMLSLLSCCMSGSPSYLASCSLGHSHSI